MRFLIMIPTFILELLGKLFTALVGGLSGRVQTSRSQGNNPERRKKVTFVAIGVTAISLVSLFFTMCERSPKINRGLFIGLGEVLADETIKAIDSHGTVVPVLATYHTTGSTPVADEWETFAKEFKKHSGVKLAEPVIVKLDQATGALSRNDFDNLVEKHATTGALVFFVGLPLWDAKNPLTLPRVAPKIIALDNTPQPYQPYFTSSIVTVLITSRSTPDDPAEKEPKTSRQWFDRYFQIVTAENYQSLLN